MLAIQYDWPLWLAGIIAISVIVLLLVFAWLGRDMRTRRLRVGFFFERDRFDKDEDA
jgi:uncharacterized membrane protein YqiK